MTLLQQRKKWIWRLKCESLVCDTGYRVGLGGGVVVVGRYTDRSSRVWSPPPFSWPERRLTTTYTLLLLRETSLSRRSSSSRSLTCGASPTARQRDDSGETMSGSPLLGGRQPHTTPVADLFWREFSEPGPTLHKGLSLVSMTKSNLQSSQQRVSEDLIHWLRHAWWTKLRLPVQRQGIISGHSLSPSQWQILRKDTHKENTL